MSRRTMFGEKLSSQELRVLQEVAEGKSNAEIAESLTCAVSTVKFHMKSIFSKFHFKNRTQAASYYWQIKDEIEHKTPGTEGETAISI